jgi:hypothetical protein
MASQLLYTVSGGLCFETPQQAKTGDGNVAAAAKAAAPPSPPRAASQSLLELTDLPPPTPEEDFGNGDGGLDGPRRTSSKTLKAAVRELEEAAAATAAAAAQAQTAAEANALAEVEAARCSVSGSPPPASTPASTAAVRRRMEARRSRSRSPPEPAAPPGTSGQVKLEAVDLTAPTLAEVQVAAGAKAAEEQVASETNPAMSAAFSPAENALLRECALLRESAFSPAAVPAAEPTPEGAAETGYFEGLFAGAGCSLESQLATRSELGGVDEAGEEYYTDAAGHRCPREVVSGLLQQAAHDCAVRTALLVRSNEVEHRS